jgi:hypothetical protein
LTWGDFAGRERAPEQYRIGLNRKAIQSDEIVRFLKMKHFSAAWRRFT